MELYLHDDTPAEPGQKHGVDGPTHAGTLSFEYEHGGDVALSDEIEQVAANHKPIVRIRCGSLGKFEGCEWLREGDRFVGQDERARSIDGLARLVRVALGARS